MDNQQQLAELNEKMERLLRDEGFVGGLLTMKTPEDVQRAFAEQGIGITPELAQELCAVPGNSAAQDGELSEEQLDTVAGGEGLFASLARARKAMEELRAELDRRIKSGEIKPFVAFPRTFNK